MLFKGAHDLWAATLVYILTFLFFCGWIFAESWEKDAVNLKMAWPWGLFCLVMSFGVTYLFSSNPSESYLELMDWIASLCLFVMALNVFHDDRNVMAFLTWVAVAFILELNAHLAQHMMGGRWSFAQESCGTLINPNIAAGFSLFWIPVFYDFGRMAKHSRYQRLICLSGLVSSGGVLVLSGSVWGMICLACWVLFVLWRGSFFSLRKGRKISSFRLASAVIGVFTLFFTFKFFLPLGGSAYSIPSYIKTLSSWWATGLMMFAQHPLVGVGLGNYPSAFLAHRIGEGFHTLFPHSILIGLLGETGLVGVLGVGVLFAQVMRQFVNNRDIVRDRHPFLGGLIAATVYSFFGISLEIFVNLMSFWILLGLIFSGDRIKFYSIPRAMRWLALAAVILLVPFLITPFLSSQAFVRGQYLMDSPPKQEGDSLPALKEARTQFQKAIALDHRNWEAYRGFAQASFKLFQAEKNASYLEEALSNQKKAMRYNRWNGLLYWEYGQFLLVAGKEEEALTAFKNAVLRHKTNKIFQKTYQDLEKALQR